MIFKTAWKNIWRNKTRSLVVIASIVVGVFAGVYSVALMNGMTIQRVRSVLSDQVGHVQITQKDFRLNNDASLILQNSPELMSRIESIEGVKSVTNRTLITGMINSTAQSSGVQIIGVDPDRDSEVFDIYDFVLPETGHGLTPESKNKILIGQALADQLHLIRYKVNHSTIDSLKIDGLKNDYLQKLRLLDGKTYNTKKLFEKAIRKTLGNEGFNTNWQKILTRCKFYRKRAKLSLTFLDKNNNQTGAVFRIAGLYKIDDKIYEKSNVFILNRELKNLCGLQETEAHQIIVKLNDIEATDEITKTISKTITNSITKLEVLSWKELRTDLAMTTEMITQFYVIFMLIILAALAFGIVNTMLMVVLERTKEIGMLAAIGMNRSKTFSMIMLESVFLSLIGGISGMAISKLIIHWTSIHGINLSMYADAFESMGYSAMIYPEIENSFFIIVSILIVITGILSAIYPAIKALRLNPADAIRTE